jgi:hypothetical protein
MGTSEVIEIAQETPVTAMTYEQLETAHMGNPEVQEPEHVQEPAPEQEDAEVQKEESIAEAAHPETISKDEYEKIRADLEKERIRRENQDKLLARLGTELGILRKSTPEDEAVKLQEIRDLYWQDPVEGHHALETYRAEQRSKDDALHQQQFIAKIEENKTNVLRWTPDFESAIDDMAALVEQDGADPQSVSVFKQNPYLLDPTTLYNLNARAKLHRENTDLKTRLEILEKENIELKKKPGDLVSKIEKAVNQPITLTAKSGGGKSADSTITDKPAYRMTSAELEAYRRSIH